MKREVGQLEGEEGDKDEGYVVAQCSSIATLGANDKYLTQVIGESMGVPAGNNSQQQLKIIFPTVSDVRDSIAGYHAGKSIHLKRQSGQQLRQYDCLLPRLHKWSGVEAGRDRAAPHIKTYMRVHNANADTLDWVLLTSANLSQQAWGQYPQRYHGSRFWLQSWELGVLITPEHYKSDAQGRSVQLVPSYKCDTLPRNDHDQTGETRVPLKVPIRMPFDLPPTPYKAAGGDVAWSPHGVYDEPDWLGNRWV